MVPALPAGVVTSTEQPDGALQRTAWCAHMPWLVHGITGRGDDMSLFGSAAAGPVLQRWAVLRDALEFATVIHARQVHSAAVLVHDAAPPGVVIGPDADGHVTARADLLLAVSVADCVPVFLAAPEPRTVALLHAGWRGIAAGVLEHGLAALDRLGVEPRGVHMHMGPAICGECYEVGSEVATGLGLVDAGRVTHVDLRAALAKRALGAGVPASQITVSGWCTRHGGTAFYSHRAGCRERQIAVIGISASHEH